VNSADEYTIAGQTPSSEPGKLLRIRIGESLFRRWPLYLLPLLLITGFGLLAAKSVVKRYVSIGTVNVASTTFLSGQTSVNAPNFGYESPATKTARDINQHLGSEAFVRSVVSNAGLTTAIRTGQLTLNDIRSNVTAAATGDNLLQIIATTKDPLLSQKLASSLMTSYTAYILSTQTAQYEAAVTYHQENLKADAAALDAANAALLDYLAKNPAPALGARPDLQTVLIDRLTAAVTSAQTRRDGEQGQLGQAQLAIKQAESDIGQRLQVVDQPLVPSSPQPIKLKRALTLGIYLILGLVVSVTALVVSALLDRTVRSNGDVLSLTGLHVVATIQRQSTGHQVPERIVPDLALAIGPP
jgi:uncharacterized protein involved in exopolysaccharide biosynthesis